MSRTTRAGAAAARRRARRAEIVGATRAVLDDRGLRDANIDDIARAVGVNRAIIYRHFSGKDELLAYTLAGYLGDLETRLAAADDARLPAPARLAALGGALADFGLEYPAFVDCALTLLRQPGAELLAEISDGALLTLGQVLAATLGRLASVLRAGSAAGRFADEDADLLATTLYLQGLGTLQLARTGFFVRASAGAPEVVPVEEARVRRLLVESMLATAAGAGGPTSSTLRR